MDSSAKVPANWIKAGGSKVTSALSSLDTLLTLEQKQARYNAPQTLPLIRRLLEAREAQTVAKRGFFKHLLAEFSKERALWLQIVRWVLLQLARSQQLIHVA